MTSNSEVVAMEGTAGDVAGGGERQRLRRLLRQQRDTDAEDGEQENLLLVSPPARKDGFTSAKLLRGLGCSSAAAAQAYSPSSAADMVRSSADWQPSSRRKKIKAPWKKTRDDQRHASHSSVHPRKNSASVGAEIWCAPGIAFASSADDSVDCVVSQNPSRGGRTAEVDRMIGERNCIDRRGGRRLEHLSSFLDSVPETSVELPNFGSDQMPSRHRRHLPNCRISSRRGLEEIIMLQSRLLLGSTIDIYDQYRDLRLDVDNMSYEELLELGDKIGHVSTGLREEDIFQCLRKTRHSLFSWVAEKSCSICQEELEGGDEMGRLACGHSYHMPCIRQWLLRKNSCPVCKTPPFKS